jgi:hypothetical protein
MVPVNNKLRVGVSLALLFASAALACKYTIRDVGFVQLQKAVYRVYCYQALSPEEAMACTNALADSNVAFETVDAGEEPDHPALKYRDRQDTTAVLRTPDGRFLALDSGTKSMPETVRGVVHSPLRDEIMRDMAKRYATVLIVPGTDAKSADSADRMVKTVADEITNGLDRLPKPVAVGPSVVRLAPEQVEAEALTLWTLGISAEPRSETQIVILMGRLRKFGEVMLVPGTDVARFRTVMGYVGQDCECALDRRWMTGLMLPHQWGMKHQIAALKGLGFDPGNPLVQTEISQILSKPRTAPDETGGEAYGEISLSLDGGDLIQKSGSADSADLSDQSGDASEPDLSSGESVADVPAVIADEGESTGSYLLVVVLAVLGAAMAIGCGVLVTRSQR